MRLIDADKLKAHYAWWGNDGAEYRERKADFDVIVDLQPTVESVKHGRWIKDKYQHKETLEVIDGATCSECGAMYRRYQRAELGYDDVVPKYCPNCGARMDAQIGEDKSHPFAESVMMGMRNEVEK